MTQAIYLYVHYIGYLQMIAVTWLLTNINMGAKRLQRIACAYDLFVAYASIILDLDGNDSKRIVYTSKSILGLDAQ